MELDVILLSIPYRILTYTMLQLISTNFSVFFQFPIGFSLNEIYPWNGMLHVYFQFPIGFSLYHMTLYFAIDAEYLSIPYRILTA